jgi:hypothetical protein
LIDLKEFEKPWQQKYISFQYILRYQELDKKLRFLERKKRAKTECDLIDFKDAKISEKKDQSEIKSEFDPNGTLLFQ